MKVLKKKFKKIQPKVSPPLILSKLKKIKPKLGKWCEYYEGRLPYPIECSTNKETPVTCYFEDGDKYILRDRSNCATCQRSVEWIPWKKREWDKIKEAIANGEDLTDMDPPFQGE